MRKKVKATAAVVPTSDATSAIDLNEPRFLRLDSIVPGIIPVSRSAWYDGIQRQVYPAPVSLGLGRAMGYRKSDIKRLVESLGEEASNV